MRQLFVTSMIVGLAAVPALAQDPVKTDPKVYHVVIDNATVRVLRVHLEPKAKTHVHEHPDTIIIPLTDAKARFTVDGKTQDREMKAEEAIWSPAEKHSGENLDGKADVILVELKGSAAPTATVPSERPSMKSTRLLENPRADVIRATAEPTFQEAAGATHEFDQVVIALAPTDFLLDVNGKKTTKWQRGDVQFIGRGVKHESQNTSKKPQDFIIVAIK